MYRFCYGVGSHACRCSLARHSRERRALERPRLTRLLRAPGLGPGPGADSSAGACLFRGLLIGILLVSSYVTFGMARYDFTIIGAVLVVAKIESRDEVLTLCAFHVPGIALDLQLVRYPPYAPSVPLSAGIYLNFFTHHFVPDFTVTNRRRSMPLVLSFVFVGFLARVAENASTHLDAWSFSDQLRTWNLVSLGKVSSWCLLVIVSFVIVADLEHARAADRTRPKGE